LSDLLVNSLELGSVLDGLVDGLAVSSGDGDDGGSDDSVGPCLSGSDSSDHWLSDDSDLVGDNSGDR